MDWFWRAGASGDWLGSVQVVENLADDDWVFDGGDALHGAAAGPAGLDVDIEYALQALSPVHGGAPILAFANRPLRALRRLLQCRMSDRLPSHERPFRFATAFDNNGHLQTFDNHEMTRDRSKMVA